MSEKLKSIIAQGEGLKVEFKESQGGLPKSMYETICAFSNTQGGEIFKVKWDVDFFSQFIVAETVEQKILKQALENGLIKSAPQATPQTIELEQRILDFCMEAHKSVEIMKFIGYKDRKHFKGILNKLIDDGLLKMTIPETPNHPNQKYEIVIKEHKNG